MFSDSGAFTHLVSTCMIWRQGRRFPGDSDHHMHGRGSQAPSERDSIALDPAGPEMSLIVPGLWALRKKALQPPTSPASQLHKQSQVKTASSCWSHCNRCGAPVPSCLLLRAKKKLQTDRCSLSLPSCLQGCRNTCGRKNGFLQKSLTSIQMAWD